MTTGSKNAFVNKLADKVNEYTNTYNSTYKMKTVDVKRSTYRDLNVAKN